MKTRDFSRGILGTYHFSQREASPEDEADIRGEIRASVADVSERQSQRSDIDFIVEFSEPSFDNFIGLSEFLEKIFGRKVDILTKEGLEGIRVASVANDIKRSAIYV